MRNRIVVGHDGSSQADDALALAARLASGTGARLTLAYIYHQEPTFEAQDRGYRRELRDRAAATLGPALEKLPPGLLADSGAFPSSTAAHGLRDLARDERADLIVIGSTHRGPIGSVLIGGVGELLCSGAPCAVAVAPRGMREQAGAVTSRVGVAFDGSKESEVALRGAVTLADSLDAQLAAITVHENTRSPLGSSARRADAAIRSQLSDALSRISPQAQADHELLRGDPVERLTEAAATIDMLVMGSRGYGPIRQTLLGGVSSKLMRSAECPVVVIPRGAPPPEAGALKAASGSHSATSTSTDAR